MSKPRAASAPAAHGGARARKRTASPSLFRRLAAAATALVLGAGLALVAAAAPASAHHNTISASAVCATDGKTADITWTVANSEGISETITSSSMPDVVAKDTTIGPRESSKFVQKGAALGTKHKLELSGKWTNNVTATNHGEIRVSSSLCEDDDKKLTICHATGSETNPYVIETIARAAVVNAHIAHQHHEDIIPAFSYKGVDYPAQGDQSRLTTGDCSKPPTEIPVEGAPSFFDSCGPDNEQLTLPEDTTKIDWNADEANGIITVTATAKAGFVFPKGATRLWTFPINDVPCVVEVVGAPTFSDSCGPDNEKLTVPADTDTIDWNSSEAAGVITVTATAKPGSAFPEGAPSTWTFAIDDNPCVIEVVGAPTFQDTCGPDNEKLTVPADTDTIDWNSSEAAGVITVTATAKPGSAFPEGAPSTWTFAIDDNPCVIELVGTPTFSDTCGPDNEEFEVPASTETIMWESVRADGVFTVTATAKPGYAFKEGGPVTWTFPYSDAECIEPSLNVSLLTGRCVADAPWILFNVALVDPDGQSTGDDVTLVITDGVNTEELELGKLDNGKLEGKVLWPGASVAADGVTPTGWPGWELVGTTWVQVDGNFAWTRGDIEATVEVNPTVAVDLSYPPATPECATGPKGSGNGGSTPTAGGTGLASTGFEGTAIGIVAGIIVVAGIAFLVIARIRRNRA